VALWDRDEDETHKLFADVGFRYGINRYKTIILFQETAINAL